MKNTKISFIGCGNMARAIIECFFASCERIEILASDVNFDKGLPYGVKTVTDNIAAAQFSDILFIAVKPSVSAEVFREIAPHLNDGKIIVSVMAGVPLAVLKAALPATKKLVRCMPNLAARVGEGMTGVCFDGLSEDEQSKILHLLSFTGRTLVTPEENFDIVTALSGSGSAYVYLFIKALAAAGAARGLSESDARLLASQTVLGSAKTALDSSDMFDSMVSAVCSKGGTTIEAVKVFAESDFANIIDKAVDAAYQKSKIMSFRP